MLQYCLNCKCGFETTVTKKVFCQDVCRALYHRKKNKCYYCGELGKPGFVMVKYPNDVKACPDCHELLLQCGHNYDTEEALQYMISKIIKDYQLDKLIPDFHINQLNENLKRSVSEFYEKRKIMALRVMHIKARLVKMRDT